MSLDLCTIIYKWFIMNEDKNKKPRRKFRSSRKGVRAGGEEDYQSFIDASKQPNNKVDEIKKQKLKKNDQKSEPK